MLQDIVSGDTHGELRKQRKKSATLRRIRQAESRIHFLITIGETAITRKGGEREEERETEEFR